MPTPKATRWLDLIAFLLYRRFPVSREDIFDNVRGYVGKDVSDDAESRRRTFERDKDELRALGIPIETVDLPPAGADQADKGYRLAPKDFYLPYLELAEPGTGPEKVYRGLARQIVTREQLERLDRGTQRIADHAGGRLAAAARSLRQKLAFDLPMTAAAVERILSEPLEGEAQKTLRVLQQAVMSRTAVRCHYYTIGRDAKEEREIEPYGLFFNWGKWYCVAWARERDALRVFRLDRMSHAKMLSGKSRRFEVPDTFSIRDYAGRAPWELSDNPPTTVRVRFRFPESRWVQNQGTGVVVEPVLDDGGALMEFSVHDRNPFLRWLLSHRGRAEVVSPSDVAEELHALRHEVAALYDTGGRE